MMIAAPPFPALCVGWVIVAYGAATQLSQTNSYVATLPNPHQALGSLHGAYVRCRILLMTVSADTTMLKRNVSFDYRAWVELHLH